MNHLLLCGAILAVLFVGYSDSCSNPEVTSKSFTTQDATIVTKIAYISEFNVNCGSGKVTSLYANINGNVVPVSVVAPNTYQVSPPKKQNILRGGY